MVGKSCLREAGRIRERVEEVREVVAYLPAPANDDKIERCDMTGGWLVVVG